MDRKEFYRRFTRNPHQTWTELAEKASDLRVKEAYEACAEAVRAQPLVDPTTSGEAEMWQLHEQVSLATRGPKRLEQIEWWLSDTWKLFFKTISRAALLIDRVSLKIAVILGLVVSFNTFGFGVVLLLTCAVSIAWVLALFKGVKTRWAINSVLLLLALVTSFQTTLVLHDGASVETDSFLVRDSKVIDVLRGDGFIHARVPFRDHLVRTNSSLKIYEYPVVIAAKNNPHIRHRYSVKVTYDLDPTQTKLPQQVAGTIESVALAVDNSTRVALLDASKNKLRPPTRTDLEFAVVNIPHTIFTPKIIDATVMMSGLEVYSDGEWYKVNSPETPRPK